MRVWAIAACITLGFFGTSSAHPLDSPGTVYIDGLPCNVACQSYMAWSRQTLKATRGTVAGGPYAFARQNGRRSSPQTYFEAGDAEPSRCFVPKEDR